MTRCDRSRDTIERAASGLLRPADVSHGATCVVCGPILARAERFDAELRTAAVSLAVGDLPVDLTAASAGWSALPQAAPRPRPAIAGLGLVAALALVAVIAVLPALLPGPVTAGIADEPSIRAAMAAQGWECRQGATSRPGTTPQELVEDVVCVAPERIAPLLGALIVGRRSSDGSPEAAVKTGFDRSAPDGDRAVLVATVARLVGAAIAPPSAAAEAVSWVEAAGPTMVTGTSVEATVDGLRLTMEYDRVFGYHVVIARAAP